MANTGRIHYLRRVVEVQNIVLDYKEVGSTQVWIYDNVIYPRFYISWSTFNEYLRTNAKSELKKIDHANNNIEKISQ